MSFASEWARCAPWLDAALEHGGRTHTLPDVEGLIRRGEAQFWPGARAAGVTVIEQDPQERRLLVWLAGGELQELRDRLLPRAEAWARARGCRRLLLIGRPGWERALKDQKFAPVARVIGKEL